MYFMLFGLRLLYFYTVYTGWLHVSALRLDDALLKCVVTEVVLFSVAAFKTLTFYKVV